MPVAPPTHCREDIVEQTMQKIDEKIEKTTKMEGACEVYRVFVKDNLTLPERQRICNEYLECGWKEATSQSSAENGERPGLIMFTFVAE